MSLIFDGIILIAVIIAIVMGAKRGFVKSIMGICTLIAAMFVAFAFTPTVSSYIENSTAVQEITDGITETLQSLSQSGENTYDLTRLFDDMPDSFKQILERYGVDASELEDTANPKAEADDSDVGDLASLIAGPVARAISGVLAFLALFVATVIILKILTWILDLLFQLPVLKTANTLLGLLIGIVSAVVWAWVLSSLSVIFISAMSSVSPETFGPSLIDNTVILKFFADDGFANILRSVIG